MRDRDLQKVLSALRENIGPDMVGDLVSGRCDALAIALSKHLAEQGLECSISAITRKTFWVDGGEERELLSENSLSHVVVEFNGTTWDIDGDRALERWEESWVESSGEETEFDLDTVTVEEIHERRQVKKERVDMEVAERLHRLLPEVASRVSVALRP